MKNDVVYEVVEHGVGPYLPGDWIGWSLGDATHAVIVVRPDGSYYTLPFAYFRDVLSDVYDGTVIARAMCRQVHQGSERVLASCA